MAIDWTSFIPTLLATFLGVGLAVLFNEIYHRRFERKQARRLLFLLKDEITNNTNLLLELEQELKNPNYTPFYDLKFVVWNTISPIITPVLNEFNIMKDISKFYYELQHIERKINKIFDLSFNPKIANKKLAPEVMQVRQQLWISLNVHIPGVLIGRNCKSPQVIINEIEHLIKRLG